MFFDEGKQVAGMESVADLMPETVETDVFEGAPLTEGVDPVSEDALGGMRKLPGSAHDAAAVDPDGKMAHGSILDGEVLARDFGGSVEGGGRSGGEGLGRADVAESGGKGGGVYRLVAIKARSERSRGRVGSLHFDVELGKGGDGVDAAGGEQDEAGAVGAAVLEEVDGAAEVVLDELSGAGAAVDAGEDGGIRGGVDDVVAMGQGLEVRGIADVAAIEFDAEFLFNEEPVPFGSDPAEVVDPDKVPVGVSFTNRFSQGRPDETADAGDEDFHFQWAVGGGRWAVGGGRWAVGGRR